MRRGRRTCCHKPSAGRCSDWAHTSASPPTLAASTSALGIFFAVASSAHQPHKAAACGRWCLYVNHIGGGLRRRPLTSDCTSRLHVLEHHSTVPSTELQQLLLIHVCHCVCRDIVDHMAGLLIEGWMHFTETFSLYIANPDVSPLPCGHGCCHESLLVMRQGKQAVAVVRAQPLPCNCTSPHGRAWAIQHTCLTHPVA